MSCQTVVLAVKANVGSQPLFFATVNKIPITAVLALSLVIYSFVKVCLLREAPIHLCVENFAFRPQTRYISTLKFAISDKASFTL